MPKFRAPFMLGPMNTITLTKQQAAKCPTTARLAQAGAIYAMDGSVCGKASDETEVQFGALPRTTAEWIHLEAYLASHATPDTW